MNSRLVIPDLAVHFLPVSFCWYMGFIQFPSWAVTALNELIRLRSIGGLQVHWIPLELLANAIGDISQRQRLRQGSRVAERHFGSRWIVVSDCLVSIADTHHQEIGGAYVGVVCNWQTSLSDTTPWDRQAPVRSAWSAFLHYQQSGWQWANREADPSLSVRQNAHCRGTISLSPAACSLAPETSRSPSARAGHVPMRADRGLPLRRSTDI